MTNFDRSLFAAAAAVALAACGGSQASPAAPSSTPPATFAEQVAAGGELYGKHCASCHGAQGEGKGAPRVVGLDKGALPLDPPAAAKFRKGQFKTAGDVAAFVAKNMPPNNAGKLSDEEYFSILAFDLKANGVDLGDKKLTPELAQTLEIPRK